MNAIALLLLLFPSCLFAQVPPATPACAERGGCGDRDPGRERRGGRERGGGEDHSSLTPAQQAYNESIDKVHEGDFDAAFIAVRQALDNDPNFGSARYQYAWLLFHEGRCDRAIPRAQ